MSIFQNKTQHNGAVVIRNSKTYLLFWDYALVISVLKFLNYIHSSYSTLPSTVRNFKGYVKKAEKSKQFCLKLSQCFHPGFEYCTFLCRRKSLTMKSWIGPLCWYPSGSVLYVILKGMLFGFVGSAWVQVGLVKSPFSLKGLGIGVWGKGWVFWFSFSPATLQQCYRSKCFSQANRWLACAPNWWE